MKNLLLLPIFLLAANITHAQAYFTENPIDKGSYQLDEKHTGTWREDKNMGAGRTYKVLSNPNKTGHISITQSLGAITPAVLSMVNNHLYLNLYEFGGKDQPAGFYIFLVEIPNGAIKLMPLKYDLQIPNNMSLYDYLAQPNLDVSAIISGKVIWLNQRISAAAKQADRTGRDINIKSK